LSGAKVITFLYITKRFAEKVNLCHENVQRYMVSLSIDNAVVLEQKQVLEQALSTNPKTQKALQKLIRQVILEARKDAVSSVTGKIKNDPRGTAQAVRTTVYKKILGANINIYNSRKAHGSNSYEPPRMGTSDPNGRGGNRRARGRITDRMMHYAPLDRGMILRWLNDGANDRVINFTPNDNRKVDKWNKHPNTGNRGSIAARNFFRGAAQPALSKAVDQLSRLIDTELENILNKKKR
jgi:hypothetical protein